MGLTKNTSTRDRGRAGSNKMWVKYKKFFTIDYCKKLIFDPQYVSLTCWLLLIFEVFLNAFIIERVKYTEIDWRAYMQEVEGFLNGTIDYKELKGDTGPLVYPAGFVYIYSLLYYVTSFGTNIKLAQYIFLVIYVAQLYLTYEIYKKTCKIPAYAIVLSTLTSYRIHSIYVLRLFNDPIATLFFYLSLHMFLKNKWYLGSFIYSIAVSVKMNILLYAPCLLIAYLSNLTLMKTAKNLFICAFTQLILGAPFLYGNIVSYMKGSFDLGRVFEHKWTVNYRFLPRDLFENFYFHIGLLVLHLLLLGLFAPNIKKYLSSYAKLNYVIQDLKSQVKNSNKKKAQSKPKEEKLTKQQKDFLSAFEKQLKNGSAKQKKKGKVQEPKPEPQEDEDDKKTEINFSKITQLFVLPFFVTNLIGVASARSLHYQFYSWYFHSLLYLVHSTPFRKPVIFLILGLIEFCWNVYPSTELSSALLHGCHIVLLYGLYKTMKQ